jgi:hypothetical protein
MECSSADTSSDWHFANSQWSRFADQKRTSDRGPAPGVPDSVFASAECSKSTEHSAARAAVLPECESIDSHLQGNLHTC